MKVLHVIDSLGAGGAETSLVELIAHVRDLGISSSVAVFSRPNEGQHERALAAGLDVRVLENAHRAGRVAELRRLIREIQPNLVHTTLYESDQIGRVASFGLAPVLSSLVNMSYGRHRMSDPNVSRLKLEAARFIDLATARLATHFHAITFSVKIAALRDLHLRPDDVTVIPRGRDRERLGTPTRRRRIKARNRLGISNDVPVVLNVGRQEHQKGQTHLLTAAARLSYRRPDVRWIIAGREGKATNHLRECAARLSLEGTVRFLGHREDVPELLCAADLFVFPSLYEGLGGAVLEAMALEVPIVASDIPPLREVLAGGQAGVLVPVGGPAALANAVDELLASEDRRQRLIVAAKGRFDERYRFDVVVGQMASLFRRVANQ